MDACGSFFAELPLGSPRVGTPDQRWYWAAPFLFDRRLASGDNAAFLSRLRDWDVRDEEDPTSRLGRHLEAADDVRRLPLGPRPDDLLDVLVRMAIAGPGVCALRALSRVTGGVQALPDPDVRSAAFKIAHGLRSLFNKPEIVALLRSTEDESYWRVVLDHAMAGGLQAVLDEYVHVLIESEGLQDADRSRRVETLAETMTDALSTRTVPTRSSPSCCRRRDPARRPSRQQPLRRPIRAYSVQRSSCEPGADRADGVQLAVQTVRLVSTSVGQEGLDFHTYCHAIVHWNLPNNPVDLEQREGRVHRYKGHAVRKNVADVYSWMALDPEHDDPWEAVFSAAHGDSKANHSDIEPFWVFTRDGGAVIERYVPALPLSREAQQYRRLLRTLVAYRLVLGQPRQDDLTRYLGEDVAWLRIDLAPPTTKASEL